MYSFIGELPFIEQLQIDNKEQLIKELERRNNKKEQNSICVIVKETNNEKQVNLNVNGNAPNQNTESPGIIVIRIKKKSRCFYFLIIKYNLYKCFRIFCIFLLIYINQIIWIF